MILTSFGLLALALGAVGVFGVTAYSVSRRVPEFGVRVALGSSRSKVVGAALMTSLTPVAGGLVMGLMAAAGLSGALKSALFGVEPSDAVTYVGVAALLAAVAVVASLLPALRASRVDPVTVLKGD
jgi:putative ABC transport system permease protein